MIKRLNLKPHVSCSMPRRPTETESIIVESLEHKMNLNVSLHGGFFTDSSVHASTDFKVTAV